MNDSLGPFNLVLFALPGLGLKVAVWAMYSRRTMASADPMKVLLSTASTLLLVVAAVGGLLGLIGIPTSPVGFFVYWLPVIVILTIAILMSIDRYRHGEHRALVWSLSAAAQRGIPLPEAARAYADETLGDTGARAMALARGLEAGLPLSLATRSARLRMATPMMLAIRLGEALGMLGQAMRQQIEDSAEVDAALRSAIARVIYLGNLIIVAAGVESFVMLKIMPVFQRMFEEFGLLLPGPTILTIELSSFCVKYGWVALVPLLILAVLFVLGGALYFLGWFPRGVLLWMPLRRYDGALVMRGLALTVRRGMPIAEGLRLLGTVYPYGQIGLLLHTAHLRVMQGGEWTAALRQAKLIGQADAAVLQAAERAGNLPWALEEMAESALRRQVYRLQVAVNLLFPVAILSMAMLGGLFAIGVFLPLIALIQGLA